MVTAGSGRKRILAPIYQSVLGILAQSYVGYSYNDHLSLIEKKHWDFF